MTPLEKLSVTMHAVAVAHLGLFKLPAKRYWSATASKASGGSLKRVISLMPNHYVSLEPTPECFPCAETDV